MAKKKEKVSNEKKNLHRLAGEFLVASRLTQRGYMVTLQWGSTISYDILVFDKKGKVAYIEVKATASTRRTWVLQKKYAHPGDDQIAVNRRFVCCVDLTPPKHGSAEPTVYVFPVDVVAKGLHYAYSGKFSKSSSYRFALDSKPRGRTKDPAAQTVGEHIDANRYIEDFEGPGVDKVGR